MNVGFGGLGLKSAFRRGIALVTAAAGHANHEGRVPLSPGTGAFVLALGMARDNCDLARRCAVRLTNREGDTRLLTISGTELEFAGSM